MSRKMEKSDKADQKYALGYAVLESSDGCKKQKRSSCVDSDTGDESDSGCISAAYRLENKVPVEHQSDLTSSSSSAAASKKRKASPPKQSRILSQQELKSMYPNLSLKSDEEEEEEEDVKLIQRKVSVVQAHISTLKF